MNLYHLSDLQFTAPYFSAMDCILNGERKCAIYCSTGLTSGLSVFEAMRQHEVHTVAELNKKDTNIYNAVIKANEEAAKAFASTVHADHRDGAIVINPAPLKRPGWEQPEYYAFWDELIRTRVKQVRFNDDWHFSNGCTYELAVALDENIPIFDSKGKSLEPKRAVAAIEHALEVLHLQGFDEALKKLVRHRDFCKEVLQRKEKVVRQPVTLNSRRAGNKSDKPSKGAAGSVRHTGRAK